MSVEVNLNNSKALSIIEKLNQIIIKVDSTEARTRDPQNKSPTLYP